MALVAIGDHWLAPLFPASEPLQMRWLGNGLMLLAFIWGLRSHLLLLQFSEPDGYLRLKPRRLIQIGYYARNRHPQWWSLQIWLLGALLTAGLPALVLLILVAACLLAGSLYLVFIDEGKLIRQFGARYIRYRGRTPFWGIKLHAPAAKEPTWVYQFAWLLGHILFRWNYRITADGLEHIPSYRSFIIVARHASYLDPFLFGIFIPFPVHFVTTADAYTHPLKQWFMDQLYTFPIRRHVQDLAALRKIIKLTAEGKTVGIFPEGERSMDGSPGEIVPETVRVLQRCKVSILPVEIEGAFEIWPRWSNARRKGKVHVRFKPVIPVSATADRDELTRMIRATIFPEKVTYHPVRTKRIAKGIEKLLWGCIACGTTDTIREIGPDAVKCQVCERTWRLESDYHLREADGARIALIEWMSRLQKQIEPAQESKAPSLSDGEVVYLHSTLEQYRGPDADTVNYQGAELILSDQAFIIRHDGREQERWRHGQITVCTVDSKDEFSLGISGKRHSFRLPSPEHPLKWHNYFKHITSGDT
ncbi:MAG: 1-acyl-sn-glycerol-3-phosphate acyltransferase [Candidatus Marinimicrobia bacterium]|nr:1-acyl-sn-glycerol-3-phosphate acyltransferase [Candidatus Neomarinimicrobiota bacterium]MCF7839497.1 1-acyl-sn-glycerol-3-phosphate acyltransferase [Candidatus Neomarinimicrobiota bacterium]MCF7902029.1 1-acyl-sn-glycerol-3-phosphate acyltransferase [Candidatus Neomarinimicrobiota bacterium]